MKKFILIPFIFFLASCSSDVPNEKDIENRLLPLFSNCSAVEVSNISKINGYEVSDNVYTVHESYTININPLKNELSEMIVFLKENREDIQNQIDQTYEFYKKDKDTLKKEFSNLYDHYNIDQRYRDNTDYLPILSGTIARMENDHVRNFDNLCKFEPRSEGQKIVLTILAQQDVRAGDVAVEGISYTFEEEKDYRKTENGWIPIN